MQFDGHMSSVALITSQYALTSPVDADRDLAPIVAALQRRGVDCRVIDWLDESARYDDLDLAVIKSPWDYAAQAERFRGGENRTQRPVHAADPSATAGLRKRRWRCSIGGGIR